MKAIPIVSGLAIVTAVAGLAFARPGMPKGKFFERMDANNDGKVTVAEAETLGKAKFTELDGNKDNVLSGDELKGPRFRKADTNGDGKITLAEAVAKGKEMFTRLDKNKDKVLTRDEMPSGGKGRGHGHGRGDCHGK